MIEATRPARQRPEKGTDDGPLLPLDGRLLASYSHASTTCSYPLKYASRETRWCACRGIIDRNGRFRRDRIIDTFVSSSYELVAVTSSPMTDPPLLAPVDALFDFFLLLSPLPNVLPKRMRLAAVSGRLERHTTACQGLIRRQIRLAVFFSTTVLVDFGFFGSLLASW